VRGELREMKDDEGLDEEWIIQVLNMDYINLKHRLSKMRGDFLNIDFNNS